MEQKRRWSLIAPADATSQKPPEAPLPRSGRQRATTACFECQTRKIKCNGENPCESCATKKLNCVFDWERDQRRKVGVKRKVDELETENANLKNSLQKTQEELRQALQQLNGVKGSDQLQVSNLPGEGWPTPQTPFKVSLEDTTSDTFTATTAPNAAGPNTSLVTGRYPTELDDEISSLQAIYNAICGCAPGAYSKVFDTIWKSSSAKEAAHLLTNSSFNILSPLGSPQSGTGSEPLLFGMGNLLSQSIRPTIKVPAKPWTTVTDDDKLVSHLVTLYFCWDYPVHCFFDKKLFLADMVAGRDRFCSKLMVNALLSLACLYAHSLDKPWDRRYELGMSVRFLVEAHQLKEAHSENLNPTMIQGLILMNITYNCLGKDKVGSQCLESAVKLAKDLDLFREPSNPMAEDATDGQDFNVVRAVTAWGLFDWQAFFAASMNKPPLMLEPPTIAFPYVNCASADQNDNWHPYPFAGPVYPSCLRSTFNARIALSAIVCRLMNTCHGNTQEQNEPGKLDALHSELEGWMRVYGSQVSPSTNPSAHVIMLHLYYHIKIVKLCETASIAPIPINFDVAEVAHSAKVAIRELVFLYRRTFGWRSASNFLSHALTYTAYSTIPYVVRGEERWRVCLETCINGLWHLSFSFPVCQYILRAIQHALHNAGIDPEDLPGDGGKFLEYFANKVWKRSSLEFLESQYAMPYQGDSDSRSLENLLLSLEGLSMRNNFVGP